MLIAIVIDKASNLIVKAKDGKMASSLMPCKDKFNLLKNI